MLSTVDANVLVGVVTFDPGREGEVLSRGGREVLSRNGREVLSRGEVLLPLTLARGEGGFVQGGGSVVTWSGGRCCDLAGGRGRPSVLPTPRHPTATELK